MSGGPSDGLAIIAQMHAHFTEKGWQPLLQVNVNGLRTLSHEKLQQLLPKVLAAPDRVAAVTIVIEAIIPGNEPPPEDKPDLSDSAWLRLRGKPR